MGNTQTLPEEREWTGDCDMMSDNLRLVAECGKMHPNAFVLCVKQEMIPESWNCYLSHHVPVTPDTRSNIVDGLRQGHLRPADVHNLNKMYEPKKLPAEPDFSPRSREYVQHDIAAVARMLAVAHIADIPDAVDRCQKFLTLARTFL